MTETHMKRILLGALLAIAGFATFFAVPAHTDAAINPQINFQGKLTNPDGTNVTDGTYSIVFSIYTVASGGTAVWTETQNSVTVSSGIFQVSLGSVTALPGSVNFASSSLYLGIKVGSDAEMTPRIQFTAAPYAFNASTADNATQLGGIASSGYVQLSPGSQQSGNINISGSVSAGSSLTFTAASAAGIQSASSQSLNITGNAASTFSTSAGQLTLQSGSGTISLGTTTTLTASGGLTFSSGGAMNIVSATTSALTLDSGTTGAVNIGTGANAKAVTIGNTTSGTTITQRVGAGTTAFTIQGASDTFIAIDATSDRVYIGGSTAVGAPTLFVLGLKSTTGDPTGTVGGMYYNVFNGDYRAYQSSGWSTIQPVRYAYLSSDVSKTATTWSDVTGLTFAVAANTSYEMTCNLIYRAAATTTGIGFALNGPSTPSIVAGQFTSNSSATALNGRSFIAYNGTGKTTGVTTANTDTYGLFTAYFKNGTTAGTLALRYSSEVSGSSVTVRSGSYCKIAEL